VIVIAAFFLVLPLVDFEKKTRYDIVFLGDSIIGTEKRYSVVDLVGEKLGMTAFNGAFGGSTMSLSGSSAWGSMSSNQWCMIRLAQAMANRDWQSQKMAMSYAVSYERNNRQAFDYFEERMETLTSIDFSKTKVLIIEHGTNDYNAAKRLDNPENLYDITTFGGALRSPLQILQEEYPDLQIVILSPLYCQFSGEESRPGYLTDFGQGTLDDYVQLERKIAEEFNIPFIDAYHNSGIWENTAEKYLADGLHLTDEGVFLLSDYVAEELQKLLIK
jgi:lysophospholipase L1-like esterase